MAGRDIGTVVLPDADLKLYLDVSVEERARRRAAERELADDARALAGIEAELRRRDGIDSTRRTAPLRIPARRDGRSQRRQHTRADRRARGRDRPRRGGGPQPWLSRRGADTRH